MGNKESQSNTGEEKEFQHNHLRLRNAGRIASKNQNLIQAFFPVANERQYEDWQKSLKKDPCLSSTFAFLPTETDLTKEGFCGKAYLAKGVYPDYWSLLSDEIKNRKKLNNPAAESELWSLIYSLSQLGSDYHKCNIKTGDIRPSNIFFNDNGDVKVVTQHSWPEESTNYEKTLLTSEKTYLSPEENEEVGIGRSPPNSDIETSEAFSTGLTLLDAALQEESYDLYRKKGDFDELKLNQKKNKLRNNPNYRDTLKGAILNLTDMNPNKRMKPKQVLEWLSPNKVQILNNHPFTIEEVPHKVENTMNENGLHTPVNFSNNDIPSSSIPMRNTFSNEQPLDNRVNRLQSQPPPEVLHSAQTFGKQSTQNLNSRPPTFTMPQETSNTYNSPMKVSERYTTFPDRNMNIQTRPAHSMGTNIVQPNVQPTVIQNQPKYDAERFSPPKREYPPQQYQPTHYEPPKYQPAKYEPPKYEQPKYEPPKYETPKYEPPKYQQTKYSPPKYQQPKYEPPKYEPPKHQQQKYQPPKYEQPKYEPPKYQPKYEGERYQPKKYEPTFETKRYQPPKYEPIPYVPVNNEQEKRYQPYQPTNIESNRPGINQKIAMRDYYKSPQIVNKNIERRYETMHSQQKRQPFSKYVVNPNSETHKEFFKPIDHRKLEDPQPIKRIITSEQQKKRQFITYPGNHEEHMKFEVESEISNSENNYRMAFIHNQPKPSIKEYVEKMKRQGKLNDDYDEEDDYRRQYVGGGRHLINKESEQKQKQQFAPTYSNGSASSQKMIISNKKRPSGHEKIDPRKIEENMNKQMIEIIDHPKM